MLDEQILRRLAEGVTPSDAVRLRLKHRIAESIEPFALKQTAESIVPSLQVRRSLKQRILGALHGSSLGVELPELARELPVPKFASLRETILSRLTHTETSFVHGSLKWGAAFAVLLLAVRAMPLVFLAPATHADISVQLIPNGGEVTVFIDGIWRSVQNPQMIASPLMIRTGNSTATVILNDDGVLRLAANTTLKLHDIGDRPVAAASDPTATLIRGKLWVLGLLPPFSDGISVDTLHGKTSINSGSASVSEDGQTMSVAVYDRGATFSHGNQTSFLVSGEKGITTGAAPLFIMTMANRVFADPDVSDNLQQDAVHRSEIAKLQDERRSRMAGILPGNILYTAKRLSEEVDVLFTLTQDARNEKRIKQADTRLSEALALIKEGHDTQASVPLTEYRDTLIAMASGTGDNLVTFLIKQQIADASVSLTPSLTSDANVQLVRTAVMDVSAAIPDTALKAKDIEGYVLVDRLAEINRTLTAEHDLTGALLAYAEVSPYLKTLLSDTSGAHPLLQKEAKSLLVTTSSLVKEAGKGIASKVIIAAETDMAKYLPAEQESALDLEQKLDDQVQDIVKRIFIFKAHLSRYNQLILEMANLRTSPNRGTLLRRLFRALPENGLGEYVLTEIKNLGDELKQGH